jgi:hypothetical protein
VDGSRNSIGESVVNTTGKLVDLFAPQVLAVAAMACMYFSGAHPENIMSVPVVLATYCAFRWVIGGIR